MSLKNEILALFEQNRGVPLSGSVLAARYNVSRNAVWKAVNALKEEGHAVETIGRKGYMLSDDSDLLSAEGIKSFLPESLSDVEIFTYKTVDSTNDEAKRFCITRQAGKAVFVSESQSRGRGRFGRSFYSPEGTGLYMSVLVRPNISISRAGKYTAAAAVAVARAIEKMADISPQIKWFNDLYIGGKKLCGIMTEASTDFETGEVRIMVVGIGVNVTTQDFPEELREKAVSIGKPLSRNRLAAALITEMYTLCESGEDFMEEYRRRCFLIGREVIFTDGSETYTGIVAGVTDSCGLIIDTTEGRKVFGHGEILEF